MSLDDAMRALQERIENTPRQAPKPVEKKDFDYRAYVREINKDIRVTSENAQSAREARVQEQLAAWHARVGERFANAQIEDPRIRARVGRKIENMHKGLNHANSLLATGNVGTGKTWIAYAYIEWMIREGLISNSEVFYGTENNALRPITQAGYRQPDMERELISSRHKVFFIDDVGRAKYRDVESQHAVWFLLLDHAYVKGIPVILTSNLSSRRQEIIDPFTNEKKVVSELEQWIGDAATDRLRYMVGAEGAIVPDDVNKRGEHHKFLDSGKKNSDL